MKSSFPRGILGLLSLIGSFVWAPSFLGLIAPTVKTVPKLYKAVQSAAFTLFGLCLLLSTQHSSPSVNSHLCWLAVSSSGLGGNGMDHEGYKPQQPQPFYLPWRFGLSCNFFNDLTIDEPPSLLAFPSRMSAMVLTHVIHLSM